jgi:hypothetical protein
VGPPLKFDIKIKFHGIKSDTLDQEQDQEQGQEQGQDQE